MKKNIFKNTIITGTLCTILIAPSFAEDVNIRPILKEGNELVPISYTLSHWSEIYVDQLLKNYDVESIYKDKDFNESITIEDFQSLIKLTIDKKYNGTPNAITREAIIHEFTKLWAEKTNQNVQEIPTIKMIIYSDTDQINEKYNHSVTVAYMKGIAKGRDTGIFDPNTHITYGEMAALILNTEKAIKEELNSDNESIVEGKLETRANYKIKDNSVIFDFELMSHYTETKELQFGSGQQFEVVIKDEEGNEVYRYSDGKFFTLAIVNKTVEPGEAIRWQDEWNMTNKEGEKVKKGKYKAEIEVLVIPKENDKKIEKDQLTTVIDFSL